MAYYSDRKVGDRRFPGPDATNEAPEPTPQNPGQFFPASDDSKSSTQGHDTGIQDTDHLIGNPYLMHNALNKLDHSLSEVIEIMENEGYRPSTRSSDGPAEPRPKEGIELVGKFQAWRGELVGIREGHGGLGIQNHRAREMGVEESGRRPSSSGPLVSQEGPMFTD